MHSYAFFIFPPYELFMYPFMKYEISHYPLNEKFMINKNLMKYKYKLKQNNLELIFHAIFK